MRSGSHLFYDYFYCRSGIELSIVHEKEDIFGDFVISIIRDPLSAIASACTMVWEASEDFYVNSLNNYSSHQIESYIKTMKSIKDYSSLLIDYNKLSNDPEPHVKHVLDILDLPIINNGEFSSSLQDNPSIGYLITSQKSKAYDMFKKHLKNKDLSIANEIYADLLKKTIL